ncbi:sodium-coupled neutral amino acid transporter [Pseudoscourfieldia marina]
MPAASSSTNRGSGRSDLSLHLPIGDDGDRPQAQPLQDAVREPGQTTNAEAAVTETTPLLAVGNQHDDEGGLAQHEMMTTTGGADATSASPIGAVCTLANCAVGAGVLGLPWAVSCLGVVGGALLCAAAACLEGRTLVMIVACGREYKARTYEHLVQLALGNVAATITAGVIILYLFGSCASYLIIIGDCLPTALKPLLMLAGVKNDVPRAVAIAAASAVTSLPLSTANTLAGLAKASALTPAVLAVLAACTVALAAKTVRDAGGSLPDDAVWLTWGAAFDKTRDPAAAIPRVVFAYQAHIPVISVMQGIRKDARFLGFGGGASIISAEGVIARSGSKNPTGVAIAVCVTSMLLCCAAYSAVGIAGYLTDPRTFGDYLVSLQQMPHAAWASDACNAAIVIIALISYPVNYLPARDAIEHLMRADGSSSSSQRARRLVMAIAWYVACLGVALTVTDLGVAFQIIGGTAGAAVIFSVPALVQWSRLSRARSRTDRSGDSSVVSSPAVALRRVEAVLLMLLSVGILYATLVSL